MVEIRAIGASQVTTPYTQDAAYKQQEAEQFEAGLTAAITKLAADIKLGNLPESGDKRTLLDAQQEAGLATDALNSALDQQTKAYFVQKDAEEEFTQATRNDKIHDAVKSKEALEEIEARRQAEFYELENGRMGMNYYANDNESWVFDLQGNDVGEVTVYAESGTTAEQAEQQLQAATFQNVDGVTDSVETIVRDKDTNEVILTRTLTRDNVRAASPAQDAEFEQLLAGQQGAVEALEVIKPDLSGVVYTGNVVSGETVRPTDGVSGEKQQSNEGPILF